MKIIQISAYFPPHCGGAEKKAYELSERLSKNRGVVVFTSDIDCPRHKQLKSTKNLKINYLRAKDFAHTPLTLSLKKSLSNLDSNCIFHIHISQVFFPEISALVAKNKKIPYIAHVRTDLCPSGALGFLLPVYKKLFLKKVLKNASKIIVLNEDYNDLISKKYSINKAKIVTIPNATDFKIVKRINIENNVSKLLFVGRLTNEKNVDLIIKSLELIKNTKIRFLIVGEGEDKQKLINLVKEKKLQKQVVFEGRLEGEKLYKKYLASSIVLLPSKIEGFSSVLLEAMATAKPIIASDIPGTRSVIKDGYNGLLVKPTPEKIAQAIQKLIDNPKLRKKLAENGLKEVKKYSWDKIIEQTEEVYKEVWQEHQAKIKAKQEKKKARREKLKHLFGLK